MSANVAMSARCEGTNATGAAQGTSRAELFDPTSDVLHCECSAARTPLNAYCCRLLLIKFSAYFHITVDYF
jgi:hypothetical protein